MARTEEDILLSAKDGAFEKCTVWVGSIPKGNCTVDCLKDFFSTYGKVINVKCRQKDDKEGDEWPYRSWAFVTFRAHSEQQKVMVNRKLPFYGTKIAIDQAELEAHEGDEGSSWYKWNAAKEEALDVLADERVGLVKTGPMMPPPAKSARAVGKKRKAGLGLSIDTAAQDPAAKVPRYREDPGKSVCSPSDGALARLSSQTEELDAATKDSELQRGLLIGRGASGRVYRGVWQGMRVAIKYFAVGLTDDDEEEPDPIYAAFQTELQLLRRLNHHNLLRVYTSWTQRPEPFIVTELMSGSLDSLLWGKAAANVSTLKPSQRIRIAAGIATGMGYLHQKGVAHRDLKSGNVLYDVDLNVKLCDFAFAKLKESRDAVAFSSQIGTPAWMAPEVLRGESYTMTADLYSYGVILWEIACRQRPFDGLNPFLITCKVGMKNEKLTAAKVDGSGLPPAWRTMMEACWRDKPDSRPQFAECLQQLKEMQRAVIVGEVAARATAQLDLPGVAAPADKDAPSPAVSAPAAPCLETQITVDTKNDKISS